MHEIMEDRNINKMPQQAKDRLCQPYAHQISLKNGKLTKLLCRQCSYYIHVPEINFPAISVCKTFSYFFKYSITNLLYKKK